MIIPDDGGIRGLSELIILREIMFRLMRLENTEYLPKPCDYFDMIGGVGTGGVIALMLGRLRMPIDLAIEKYVNFSRNVSSDVKKWSMSSHKFKASVFESGMRDILRSAGSLGEAFMQEDDFLCRSFVVALIILIRLLLKHYICSGYISSQKTQSMISEQVLLPVVPAPSPLFTGRADILLYLAKYFNAHSVELQIQQRFVLYGLGGAGKTQIAWEFCHKFGSRFATMYIINASSQASTEQSLIFVAQSARLTDITPTAAFTWFYHQKKEWLIIFDNADDPDVDLQDFFPDCSHGNILITCRNEASRMYAQKNYYKIGEMSVEDSLAVFYKTSQRRNTEEVAAQELVQELGYLALAIVQAGSYLFHNPYMKISQYLQEYKEDKSRYLKEVREQKMDKYQYSVFATWDLSYQKLDERAKDILMLCGVLHHSEIPVSIFQRAWTNISYRSELEIEELQNMLRKFLSKDKIWNDISMERSIDMLRKYSLVEISGQGEMLLNIHSLVHEWALKSLPREKQVKAQQGPQQLFYCLCLRNEEIEYKAIKAMSNLAAILWKTGRLEKAEELRQQVLKAHTKALGTSHPETIKAMSNLAAILWKAGRLEKAEGLGQQVLKDYTKVFGSSHLETIQAMSNLAATLWTAKRLDEAEKLEQQVLKAHTEAFGSRHPDTIQAMSNLAATLGTAGRLEEAEELGQQVLKACTEAFGTSHTDTIQAMSNLAATLRKSQKLNEAEELDQQVLKACTEALESSNPDTIQAMSNLAATLRKNGKLQEAEELD
ncbi:Nephrocystin-3 [Termitomyces sp. J132]|nr:Nephrocystin-3 [Termitomyces sp. J132]